MENQSASIRWKQLWSLAALYGSVLIGWIAYYRYQPKLLSQFSLTHLTFFLVAAQGIILVITPMIAGKIGDRYRLTKGHRLFIVTAGISVAAMIFMAVAFTLISNLGDSIRLILPVLIILWLISMGIFTSPALSTIELFAPIGQMPRAMAVLTIVGNLIYSVEPIIIDIIDYLGAPNTFIVGGVAVFISGFFLRKTSLSLFKNNNNKEDIANRREKTDYTVIILIGLVMGVTTTVLLNIFPGRMEATLGQFLGGVSGSLAIAIILGVSALLSWPVSIFVIHRSLMQFFWISLLMVMLSIAGILLLDSVVLAVFFALTFSVGFTLLSVSSLPIVIQKSSFSEKVFGVGIFYSSIALADGILETILAY